MAANLGSMGTLPRKMGFSPPEETEKVQFYKVKTLDTGQEAKRLWKRNEEVERGPSGAK